jgi:hypothetical protein
MAFVEPISMLDRVRPIVPEQRSMESELNDAYGYQQMTDEEKRNLLARFLQYVRESKERDRIRLQQKGLV